MEQNLLTAEKVLYILTKLVGVFKSWMALITNISSMIWENVEQIKASHQLDLISPAAKNVKWTPNLIPPRATSALKKRSHLACLEVWN